jgi:hypothetical protein
MVSKKTSGQVNWVLLKTKIYDIDTLNLKQDGKRSATSFVQKSVQNILGIQ